MNTVKRKGIKEVGEKKGWGWRRPDKKRVKVTERGRRHRRLGKDIVRAWLVDRESREWR